MQMTKKEIRELRRTQVKQVRALVEAGTDSIASACRTLGIPRISFYWFAAEMEKGRTQQGTDPTTNHTEDDVAAA